MNDLFATYRIGTQPRALHFSFEKAGHTLHDQPIPWSAEAVLVEATLRLPNPAMRRKADYQLRIPHQEDRLADHLNKVEPANATDDRYSLSFRTTPPSQTITVELLWRGRFLGRLDLPFLSQPDFLAGLKLQMPSLSIRLGEQYVSCQTYVSTQSRGLLAQALLTSATAMTPLNDFDFAVELQQEDGTRLERIPIRLSSSHLASRQALLAVSPTKFPRRQGTYWVEWQLGDRVLARQRIRGISRQQFERSLQVCETRFLIQQTDGSIRVLRQIPQGEQPSRLGPCYLLMSSEAGMAGLCPLQIVAQIPGAVQHPVVLEENVLITDGPTLVAPGTLEVVDIKQISAFDLSLRGRSMCLLALSPTPAANFNSEGGFKPPPDYLWSATAEEELSERLTRLFEDSIRQD